MPISCEVLKRNRSRRSLRCSCTHIFLDRAFFGMDFFLAESLLMDVFFIDLMLVVCVATAFFLAMIGSSLNVQPESMQITAF
jgi:hypothetical protein